MIENRRGKRRRWRCGDIIAVALPDQYRYLQYVGRLNDLDLLRVIDFRSDLKCSDVHEISRCQTSYWICSICNVLVDDARFEFSGSGTAPTAAPVLRRPALGGGWLLVGGRNGPIVQIDNEVAKLSIEEALPAGEIVKRLLSEWRPECDREDLPQYFARLERERQNSVAGRERETIFYAEFSEIINASKAMEKLSALDPGLEISQTKRSLSMKRAWFPNDTLEDINLVEGEIARICDAFGGKISGRETSV